MSQYLLSYFQTGLEATAGTLVACTFKHFGAGTVHFNDAVIQQEFGTGNLQKIVELTSIADTGTTFTLGDTDFSAEAMIWMGNRAIKSIVGPASSFAFTFPTTAVNTIKTFTVEFGTASQEYEAGYCITEHFNIHGDVGENNGRVMYNEKIFGRLAAASTVTGALDFLALRESLNINNATIHFDTIGTAAGTAAATTGYLKGFSLDVETGWNTEAARFASGRSTKDFAVHTFTKPKITGTLKVLMNATAVTQIGYARAGTPQNVALKLNGTSSRKVEIDLALVFTDINEIGGDSNGLLLVDMPFEAGYSQTSTAQGSGITVTASASATVT